MEITFDTIDTIPTDILILTYLKRVKKATAANIADAVGNRAKRRIGKLSNEYNEIHAEYSIHKELFFGKRYIVNRNVYSITDAGLKSLEKWNKNHPAESKFLELLISMSYPL